jgi:hypothetical protein
MSFSDRLGLTKLKSILQVKAMDDDWHNGLRQPSSEAFLRSRRGGAMSFTSRFARSSVTSMLIF